MTPLARRGWLAVALGGLVHLFYAGGAARAAEPDPVALLWAAPAGCPTADAVHEQTEKALGATVKQLGSVAAVVTVAQGVGRWQANLTLHSHGKRSERTYEAESCGALAEATALIVALAAEGEDAAVPAGASSAPPHQGPESPLLRTEPRWTRSSRLLQIGLTFDKGTLPYSFAPGIEGSAGLSWDASLWRLRLLGGASYFLPEDGTTAFGSPGELGRYWLATFALRGCATAVLGSFEMGPCVGGEFAVIHGSDVGSTGASDSQYWVSPIGAIMLEVRLTSSVALLGRTDLAFPTTLRTVMGGSAPGGSPIPIYDIPSHAVRAVAAIELRFF